jgi:GT2 family glycosyltransferase
MLGWIDDVDFSSRLAATGDAWLVPGSVVVHDDGTTAAAFGAELRDRLRRLRDEPPVETMWRNAYGLRNLVCWGRASGFVRRRHAVAYALILSTRAALFAPDHRVLRVRIYLRMAIDGWRGRLRSAPPAQWPLIATWRGSVASFLDAHEMHHHGQAVDAVEQEQPAPA